MRQDNLKSCLRLLRLLREPHTVKCLAHQIGMATKTIRRDIAALRAIGFDVRARERYRGGPKEYRVVAPCKTFRRIMDGTR